MHIGNHVFAICDAEREYAFRFMEHLRTRQNLSFRIRVFTDPEKLISFANRQPPDILLISERSMTDEVASLKVKKLIVLTEKERGGPAGPYPSVYKYQSADSIVREIMNSCGNGEKESAPGGGQNRHFQVYGVFSPVPYAQKMLFSMALGMAMAREKPVLYLNLEPFSGFEEFLGRRFDQNLSDLIYLFRQNHSGFSGKLGEMTGSAGGLDYLPPIRTPSDYLEITGEEWIRVFERIGEATGYDALLLDLGQSIPDILLLLAYCSRVFVPVADDYLSGARVREFEELLEKTGNGAVKSRMQKVVPPVISVTGGGQTCVEKLPWSALGGFAQSLYTSSDRRMKRIS